MPYRPPPAPAGVEIDGAKLREMRKLRGETLEVFAARAGISFGYLSQLERHRRDRCSPTYFARICDALDVPPQSRAILITAAARRRTQAAA